MDFFQLMKNSCDNEKVEFDEQKYAKFDTYRVLLKEWNEKINITAITEDEEIIKKHFIDSIKIFKFEPLKKAQKVIDVGTGGGFPGIPMKIIMPDLEMVLLDSLNKRINFLNEVIKDIKLEDIKTIHGRAEDAARMKENREKYDAAVSRAVANLATLSELCLPFVKVGGYFVAMKGPAALEELEEAKKAIEILGGQVEDIIKVEIEGSELNHNIVVIKKKKKTPAQYPRKAGTANRNPLK